MAPEITLPESIRKRAELPILRFGNRLNISFPSPDEIIFGIDHLAGFLEAAFFQDAGGRVRFGERVRANCSYAGVAGCKVEQGLSGFASVTSALETRRDPVADLDDATGIRRCSKTAHSDHDIVDSVHDRGADFPGIGFRRGLKLRKKIWRSGKKELAHAFDNAHARELFIGAVVFHQCEEMRGNMRNQS
jgi:hypothetical protein